MGAAGGPLGGSYRFSTSRGKELARLDLGMFPPSTRYGHISGDACGGKTGGMACAAGTSAKAANSPGGGVACGADGQVQL